MRLQVVGETKTQRNFLKFNNFLSHWVFFMKHVFFFKKIRRASGPKACGILSLAHWYFWSISHGYKGPARGRLASKLVPPIGIRRPLKSSKTYGFLLVLPLVAAESDWPFCNCVKCCERFRSTGVMRERFLHFRKVCDFNA